MKKIYQKFTMLFLMLLVSGTIVAADPVAFEYYEDFDDATHFTTSTTLPDGWKSEGTYAFSRNTGNYFGVSAKSGDYVFATASSYAYGRDEVFYTPMMKLAAGKACTITFSLYAPGGNPPAVRNNGFTITAGTAQTDAAQTIEVGKVANGAYTSWTDYAFSFKPETDGEYCFKFKIECSMATSGNVALDNFNITGFSPAEITETKPAEIVLDPFYAQIPMAFIGETYTTTVNVKASNLVEDIKIANVSTSEIVPAVNTIPMADAMSAAGYDLVVTVAPTSMQSYGGSFELTTANLAESTMFQMFWTAIETTDVATLADLKNADADKLYKYTGQATVTFVDAEYRRVYMQEANDGVRVNVDDVTGLKVGDVISAQCVGLQQDEDGLSLFSLTEKLNVVSSDAKVTPQVVTLATLASNATDYVNELVVVKNAHITDFESAVYSDATVSINDGTNGLLKPFEGTDLIGANKVVNIFNLTGISTSDSTAVVAPRALADIQVLAAEVMASPMYAQVPIAFLGETYTTKIIVYGSNLVSDIAIKNFSTDQLTTSVDTIPMADAMSDTGYALDVVLKPTDLNTFMGTFELVTDGAEAAMFQIYWTPAEATNLETLQGFKDADADAGLAYKYVGEALVTHVDVMSRRVYMQDASAGVRVYVDNINDVKVGDKVSSMFAMVQQDVDGLTVISLNESLNIVSNDNVVEPKYVTLKKLATNAADYVNELVRVREVSMADAATTFSAEGNEITDGAKGCVAQFEESEVIGTAAPAVFNLVGIVTCDTAAVVAPRSVYDIEEIFMEPNPENYSSAYELPYFNTFDNYDNDYDGTTVVPAGWKSVGSSPFFTANINGVSAVTGSYYIVADESADDERDDRLYTPLFRMVAGKEYTVSYYLYMPGNSDGGILRATDLRVTVGTEQDIDFQPITVQLIEDKSIGQFTKQEFKFTPEESGAYCFAFSLNTDVNYSGIVAIEDFNITAPGLIPYPIANFGFGGIYEIFYSNMLTYPNTPVVIKNLSADADSYAWTVSCPDGTQLTSTEENPEFIFNQTGNYNIALEVKNTRGTRSTNKNIPVQYISENYDGSLTTWNPNHDAMYERGLLPSFADLYTEDYDYDFVAGYNRFYRKMAERFEMPDNVSLEISTLNVWLAHYKNRAFTSGYDSEKPFSIVFYGETNGRIDTTKVFGRLDTTLKDVFGNSGIGGSAGEARDVNFEKLLGTSVKTQGTFYLAFEFADDMTVTTTDPNLGRSYLGMNTIEHASGEATLYAMPTSVPHYSPIKADGNWYRIDEIDPSKKALGNYFILWAKGAYSGVAINSMGKVVFATRVEGDNLYVSGTIAGETIAVYNINGQLVTTAVAQEASTIVELGGLNKGVYVVKALAGTSKFVK